MEPFTDEILTQNKHETIAALKNNPETRWSRYFSKK